MNGKGFFVLTVLNMAAAAFAVSSASAQSSIELVTAALSHPDRPPEEAADDASRMPAEVLAFAEIDVGMNVLELEAGGGWYTEILAHTVGSDGMVYMQNPPAFESFTGDADDNRAARLSNVALSSTNFDQLEPTDGSIDLVTWILGPHELWFLPDGESLGDPEVTFAEIARVMKSGGRFLVVDHHAADDAGPEVGGTLHRGVESVVVDLAVAAGLSPVGSSDMHINLDDPLTSSVFDPDIQGQTSKMVLLFEKPADSLP